MEQARIPLLGVRHTVHGIGGLLVEIIEHRQAVLGLEGVHQVLGRLVEIPAAAPHAPASVEHVAPVGPAEAGIVVFVVGMLDGEDALLGILVLRKENVTEVLEIAILGVLHVLRVGKHLLHVLRIDMAHAGIGLITVTPGHGQIALRQISGGGDLVGTAAFGLHGGKVVVGELEIGHNLLHQFFMGESVVGRLLLGMVLIDFFVHPRNLIPELDQLEVEMGAEEADFGLADRLLVSQLFVAEFADGNQGTVATAHGAIEVIPQLVHVVRRGSGEGGPNFQGMVVGVGGSGTTLVGVVTGQVAEGPEVERIGVPVISQTGVGGGDHLLGLAHGQVFADDALGLHVDELVAAHECSEAADGENFI